MTKSTGRDARSHDGSEQMLQLKAGYNDARPLTASSAKPLATHGRTIHKGQSLHGRPSGKSGHVGYGSESGSKFRAISGSARGRCGLMGLPGRYSSFETGASNHALRIQRT